jgi:diguanylate cyclase (GGDEF)-like protein
VFIADDDPVSRTLLKSTLERFGHEVLAVSDGTAAKAELQRPNAPRLAILDWMMPGCDGLDVCRAVRERSDAYIYIILLTARDSPEDVVAGLDAGADDFLTKPFNAGELRARLRSGTRVLDLQTGLLEAQEALRVHATRDHLTGLWNRRMILELLEQELNRARREQQAFAIALLDIDRFKSINDAHGHSVGDLVLRESAAAIRSQLREYDAVGRFGGEEFLVLLPGCNTDAGRVSAERVRMKISAAAVQAGDVTVPVTISLGVASTDAVGTEANALLEAADAALYRAKENGRNRVEVAESRNLAAVEGRRESAIVSR